MIKLSRLEWKQIIEQQKRYLEKVWEKSKMNKSKIKDFHDDLKEEQNKFKILYNQSKESPNKLTKR